MSFDISAQNKFRKLPENKLLNTSIPPMAIRRPNNTTMCINNFFLDGIIKASEVKNRIGRPIIDGINDVKDELAVAKFTIKPHNSRNIPYKNEIDSIFKPINLYSFCIIKLI